MYIKSNEYIILNVPYLIQETYLQSLVYKEEVDQDEFRDIVNRLIIM